VVVPVGKGLALAIAALVVLLACVGTTVGLDVSAWVVGLASGFVLCLAVGRGMGGGATHTLGPADDVTLARAILACVLAALVAQSFVEQPPVPLLVGLAVTALVLDAVDGLVARSTRTVSHFGARFDGEADAFLILVLSVWVARSYGEWVLAIGAARYAFAAAGWVLPWLRARLPFRYWRKVVAATQGVVLTVAAAEVAPQAPTSAALVVALALLAESFGRDVVWLWRHRSDDRVDVRGDAERGGVPLR
jgi:phosphatidylglycerophosphate synthase